MPASEPARQHLIPVPDTATRLGISERTVWELISKGALPIVRIGTRTVRVSVTDLQEFIDVRRERRGAAE